MLTFEKGYTLIMWNQCYFNLNYTRCHSAKCDFNSLRPRQNRRHFADDVFKCNFLNENVWISIEISLKFVPKGPINNIPALVRIMAWRRSGDKPLSEPIMVSLLTHICVTRPQWVNQRIEWRPLYCSVFSCDHMNPHTYIYCDILGIANAF